jgi:hypothetical protein
MPKSNRKDWSPRKKLAPSRGELWLEFKVAPEAFEGLSLHEVLDRLAQLVNEQKLGKYTGRSTGSGAADLSFTVKNRAEVALKLRKIVKKNFPSLEFSVSDEYEANFHSEQQPEAMSELEDLVPLTLAVASGWARFAWALVRRRLGLMKS